MKKLLLLSFLFSLFSFHSALAAEAPPSLDLGNLFGDQEQPPQLNLDFENDEEQPPQLNLDGLGDNQSAFNISNARIQPSPFNPLVEDALVTYTLNGTALIEVKIQNFLGQTVTLITNNTVQSTGSQQAQWKGTIDNSDNGQLVESGTYTYKITARDQNTSAVLDTEVGSIIVQYASAANNPVAQQQEIEAIMAIQNTPNGTTRTSETGPAMLLYTLLPIAGFVYARRKF
ncbi:hypothetical protein KA119_00445 [Candidatus Gracilibacteria bacterium]|nr:hypothetical protein [Candidatus Gracilibacteria bacterium]